MAGMRNPNPLIVAVLKEKPPRFQCKRCGQQWSPSLGGDGRLARGSWQCPTGCKAKIGTSASGTRLLLGGFLRDLTDIQGDPKLSEMAEDKLKAITCRLAVKDTEKKIADLAQKGIVEGAGGTQLEELAEIEKEPSALTRLQRRVEFTSRLLHGIEKELKWIREKWGL
jgi:hypothetical protein